MSSTGTILALAAIGGIGYYLFTQTKKAETAAAPQLEELSDIEEPQIMIPQKPGQVPFSKESFAPTQVPAWDERWKESIFGDHPSPFTEKPPTFGAIHQQLAANKSLSRRY